MYSLQTKNYVAAGGLSFPSFDITNSANLDVQLVVLLPKSLLACWKTNTV